MNVLENRESIDNSPTNKIEYKIASLKKNTELEAKGIFLISSGLDGFTMLSKKFEKTMYEYSNSFYKEMKEVTKTKQRKIPKDDILNIRYNFKNGYFTEIIKDQAKSVKFYQESYDLLITMKESGYSKYSSTEMREVGDLIVLKFLTCYLCHYNIESALTLFKKHFDLFSRDVSKIKDKIKFIEINWRLNWMKIFGLMIQKTQLNKIDRFKDFWYFPGYYYLNCLHLMQQKVKIFQVNNYFIENEDEILKSIEGKDDPTHPLFTVKRRLWFDPHEFQSQFMIQENDFIGKNPIISKEPNPMVALDHDEYKNALIMFKVYNELSFDYEYEFENMLKKTLDWYTNQEHAERMIDYIHSIASNFYFKQSNFKKWREMKSFVAKRLARQSWNSVAVDLIENVKLCSQKLNDYESFMQSEFELNNVKKEDIEIKKQRMNRILDQFENARDKTDQTFTLNNPLIRVYARFDRKRAEIFDSVTLSIRIISAINFSFNKLNINFNEKAFNKEIFDEDGGELKLLENNTFQNDITIFIHSHIKSDLKLDYIVMEKLKDGKKLCLNITPIPDINIDNLIFGIPAKDEAETNYANEDNKDALKLKISDTRQKIDLKVSYKENVFLGELAPVDFLLKWRKGWEIVDARLELGLLEDTEEPPPYKGSSINSRKSTSITVPVDFDASTGENPFDAASKNPFISNNDPDIYFSFLDPNNSDPQDNDERNMEILPADKIIHIPDFDEHKDINIRICLRLYYEGSKKFKVALKYKIIKVYDESKSDPIPMSISKLVLMKCHPPFKIEFDYEIKDWLTNELNINDYEANGRNYESFIKLPIAEKVPLSISIASISERPMTIQNVDIEILNRELLRKVSRNQFSPVHMFEEGDVVWAAFIIEPIKCSNDTEQYGDVFIEWHRESGIDGKMFRSIWRLPIPSVSIVSSPLCVDIKVKDTCFKLWETFPLEIEIK